MMQQLEAGPALEAGVDMQTRASSYHHQAYHASRPDVQMQHRYCGLLHSIDATVL